MKIIEINNQEWQEIKGLSTKGKRVKCWLEKNVEGYPVYLFKEPKVYKDGFVTLEIWTEIIAYYVGKSLRLNIPEVIPAKYDNYYGILVKSFIEKDENGNISEALVDAQDFFKKNSTTENYHNLYAINKFIKFMETTYFCETMWNEFKKMLIFDCIIGNNDRHDENWGFCFDNENCRFAPIFDNASCLTSGLHENKVDKLLSDEKYFEKYIRDSKPPNLYWSYDDETKYRHFEIIEKLIKKEPDTLDIINDFLQVNYIDQVNDIINKIKLLAVPEQYKLSDNRATAIIKILERRKEKLIELVNNVHI